MNFIRAFAQNRGAIQQDAANCMYCGRCQKVCHHGAIAVDTAKRSWQIDHDKCYRCGHCVRACPRRVLTLTRT
jgi:formate hydrogenlyase subunit 6/NADH:ubiquinone oxidoreductase subunit I